jgi:hypothetical protein
MARAELGVSSYFEAITPSDSTNMTSPSRALYVGTGGNLNVLSFDSATNVLFRNLPSGFVLPISVIRVNSTDTTASNIVSLT